MHKLGGFFAKPRPFLPGDFVTTDQGTGLVHMAPDHGEDDFDLCKANGIDPVFAVEADGKYREDWAWLGGQGSVINAKFNAPDGPICSDLRDAGALLAASADFQHSYPHSWRSKAKVIYRCTPQWFIAMDTPLESGRTLRETAMQAIADTRFVPEKGRNRLGAMVEQRPDWVVSRQRAWGVPIALFVERKTGELLVDADVNRRIVDAVRAGGVDAWTPENAAELLGSGRNPDDYEMVGDILDVWFDSGCTHVFTLESGQLAGPALAGRPLSRRLRPAPRLVPVEPAGELRHARAGAVQGGADPRLHDGPQGHENVQEPRQHRQSARFDARLWRGHLAAVGALRGLHRGPPDRQGDPRRGRRPVSQIAEYLPLPARRARRFRGGRAARAMSRLTRSSSATCCR